MNETLVAVIFCVIVGLFSCSTESAPAANCPPGDLSGDCRVDLTDAATLADYWLDGTVVPSIGAQAHWPMDVVLGSATEDASGNGLALGLFNGASLQIDTERGSVLSLDGYNDYGRSSFVVNPADGPLSVFAWVKGGDNRECILTQTDGAGIGREWLQIDTSGGKLITRLTDGYTILRSDASVTDGQWHHVGVVWDGQRRYLYVDAEQVARDHSPLTQSLQACDGDIHVGAGKNIFWGGSIDDVRIYSRALGADEIAVMANPPEAPPDNADLNGDHRVDLKDFTILARDWRWDYTGEYRCIWVDTWSTGILNASQCNDLIQTCRDANINTVIVEIRKVGDAYYDSNLEPRATNISASFDPLGYLLDIAHDTSGGKKYVEVHGWFVAQRISTSSSLHRDHVLSRHPEYVMLNSDGQASASGSNTRFLDPGHPGAVEHNVAVILDCLGNYDIDGINLDYIRYPEYAGSWGYNVVSIARFNDFCGKSGQPSASDVDWSDWRRECVTQQVKKIYVKSLMIDADVVVTADTVGWGSTWANFESSRAYSGVFQDWVGWLRAGIIDYNALMGYRKDWDGFEGWCKLSLANDEKRGSILSTGAYMQDTVQDAVDQLLAARSWGAAGLNIYDWYSEVKGNDFDETRGDFYRELKSQVYPEWVDPPVHPWKVRPTTGILEGNLTAAGSAVDHGTVQIEGLPSTKVYTDGAGWYAIMEVEPGEHLLRFSKPGYPDVLMSVIMPAAGEIVTVDANLN